MCQKDYCQKLRNLEGKLAEEEGSPIFFTKEEGLCTGTAVNRMIVADIHWKLIWFPLAVLGSIASRRLVVEKRRLQFSQLRNYSISGNQINFQ